MQVKTRLVFWGSPRIAADFLTQLVEKHANEFEVVACVTQTEKVIQRQGKAVTRSAVHDRAESLDIPVFTPLSVKKEADSLLEKLAPLGFDLFVVLAYGKILPHSIIDAPRLKSVNFHASLLPLLRGASPIEHAVLQGFSETGWTLQRITAELDAGDIVAQSRVAITGVDTTATLYEKLTASLLAHGGEMLAAYAEGRASAIAQNPALATHCGKISADDGRLDFTRPAMEIRNRFRAFTPRPGVFALFRGKKLKLGFDLEASLEAAAGEAGALIRYGKTQLGVLCGDGRVLRLASVTPEGKKTMAVADFMNGYRLVGADDRLVGADDRLVGGDRLD